MTHYYRLTAASEVMANPPLWGCYTPAHDVTVYVLAGVALVKMGVA